MIAALHSLNRAGELPQVIAGKSLLESVPQTYGLLALLDKIRLDVEISFNAPLPCPNCSMASTSLKDHLPLSS